MLNAYCSLGKTIQTITRIMDGRPKKADKADGWAASTLCVHYIVRPYPMTKSYLESFVPWRSLVNGHLKLEG